MSEQSQNDFGCCGTIHKIFDPEHKPSKTPGGRMFTIRKAEIILTRSNWNKPQFPHKDILKFEFRGDLADKLLYISEGDYVRIWFNIQTHTNASKFTYTNLIGTGIQKVEI